MKFYEKFEKLLKENNITISKLSKELGIPYTTLDSIIKKKLNSINLDNAFKIANYFNVSVEYLANENVEEFITPSNKTATTELEQLGEAFPEGVSVLRRATKQLTPEAQAKMIKLMKAFIEEE